MNATNDIRALHAKVMKTGCATTATIKVNGQKCLVKVSPPKDGQQQVHVSTLRAPLGMRECSQTEFTYDEKHIGEQLGKFSEKIIEAEINAMCEKTISTSKNQKNSLMINDRKCEIVTYFMHSDEQARVAISYAPPDSQKRYHACEFMHKRGESLAEHIAEASEKILQSEGLHLLLGAKANGIYSIVAPIVERFHQPIAEKEVDVRMGEIGTILENIRTFAGQNHIRANGLPILKTVLDKLVSNEEMIQGSNGNFSINDCSDPACRKVALQVEGLQLLCDELLISSLGVNNIIASIAKRLHQPILEEEMDMRMGQIEAILGDMETFMQQNPMPESSIATLKTALGKLVDNKKMIQRSNGNSSINECDSPACRKIALRVEELQLLLDIKADGVGDAFSSITDCLCILESLHLYLPASGDQIDGKTEPIRKMWEEVRIQGQIDGQMELIGKRLEKVRTFVQRAFMRQENSQMGPLGNIAERARVSAKRTLTCQNPLSEASLSALKKAMAQLASEADMVQLPKDSFSINKYDNSAYNKVVSQIKELQILLDTKASKIGDILAPIIECLHQPVSIPLSYLTEVIFKPVPVSRKDIGAQMRKIEKVLKRTRTFIEKNYMSKTDIKVLMAVLFRLAHHEKLIQFPGNFSTIGKCTDPACRKVVSQIEELEILFHARAVANTRQSVELDQQRIAAEMASECFDASGKIDLGKARELRNRIKPPAVLPGEFSTIPGASLMLSQVSCVLDNLIDHAQEAGSLREIIDRANKLSPGDHGRQILDIMGDNLKSPVKPGEAILISLFSLHRQKGLPSCAINSIINAELRNHPERIAKILEQILAGPTFNFPGGRLAHQEKIIREDGRCYIPASLVFGNKRERGKIFAQENLHNYLSSGIERDSNSTDGLLIPVKDLNDVFFANFFQNSGFGHNISKFGFIPLSSEGAWQFGTMFVYYGIDNANNVNNPINIYNAINIIFGNRHPIYSDQKISVAGADFEAGMERLKGAAEEQKVRGMHYMRVVTKSTKGNHAENIDIDALLKLDLDALKVGKPHIIGDRNWVNEEDHPKFLAIVKTIDPSTNTPAYSFQTVYSEDPGDPMEEANISRFNIYQSL